MVIPLKHGDMGIAHVGEADEDIADITRIGHNRIRYSILRQCSRYL